MNKRIVAIENGINVEYDVIIEFTSNKNNKQYIAYTDNKPNEEGRTKITLANYKIENEKYILFPIENEEEIEFFKDILKELEDSLN